MPIEVSVEISKSIDEVFSYVTNSSHAFVWRSALIAVTSVPKEGIKVGYTFQERTKLLDQIVETTYEVVEWMPPRRLTYKSIVGDVSGLISLRFEQTTSGTRVLMRAEQSFDLAFPQHEQLAIHAIRRILQGDLQTLKEVLESH